MPRNPNADAPAFPADDRGDGFTAPGLTKREHFAALALQGILAYRGGTRGLRHVTAADAVLHADALIDALDEGGDDAT